MSVPMLFVDRQPDPSNPSSIMEIPASDAARLMLTPPGLSVRARYALLFGRLRKRGVISPSRYAAEAVGAPFVAVDHRAASFWWAAQAQMWRRWGRPAKAREYLAHGADALRTWLDQGNALP